MRLKGSKNAQQEKVCEVCGTTYQTGNKRSRYCSNACKCKNYYPQTNKKKHRFRSIIANIKTRDPSTELTIEIIEGKFKHQNGLCAITGFPMTSVRGIGIGLQKDNMYNVSVDRVDQTKGYTIENTRLVCIQANMMRSILSDNELLQWCHAIETNLKKEANRKKGK